MIVMAFGGVTQPSLRLSLRQFRWWGTVHSRKRVQIWICCDLLLCSQLWSEDELQRRRPGLRMSFGEVRFLLRQRSCSLTVADLMLCWCWSRPVQVNLDCCLLRRNGVSRAYGSFRAWSLRLAMSSWAEWRSTSDLQMAWAFAAEGFRCRFGRNEGGVSG